MISLLDVVIQQVRVAFLTHILAEYNKDGDIRPRERRKVVIKVDI